MISVEKPSSIIVNPSDVSTVVLSATTNMVAVSGGFSSIVIPEITSNRATVAEGSKVSAVINAVVAHINPSYHPNIVVSTAGARGPSGTSAIVTSPGVVGGQRVISLSDSGFVYAEPSSGFPVIGFTPRSLVEGEVMELLTSGNLGGFIDLIPAKFIFLAANGTITQEPPTSGYLQVLGIALSSTKITIRIQTPIFLG